MQKSITEMFILSRKKLKSVVASLIIIVLAFVGYLWEMTDVLPQKEAENLRIHFIDVGEGDSTLLELPGGKVMLVDAGEAEKGKTVSEYLKKLKIKKIDYLVGTHPHFDHVGGLETILDDFEVEKIYMPKAVHNTVSYESLLKKIKSKNKKVCSPKAGDIIHSENGGKITVLSPKFDEYENLNNYSIVLDVSFENTTVLLTGDAENEVLDTLEFGKKADILKVPHHGSDTSASEGFYEKVRPTYGVISLGKHNKYGHPHKDVMSLLEKYKTKCFRTDTDKTIVFELDGENIEIIKSGE